jgi:hypothetical protein
MIVRRDHILEANGSLVTWWREDHRRLGQGHPLLQHMLMNIEGAAPEGGACSWKIAREVLLCHRTPHQISLEANGDPLFQIRRSWTHNRYVTCSILWQWVCSERGIPTAFVIKLDFALIHIVGPRFTPRPDKIFHDFCPWFQANTVTLRLLSSNFLIFIYRGTNCK